MNSRGSFGKLSKVHVLEVFRPRAKRTRGIYTPAPDGCWLIAAFLSTSGLPPGGSHSLGQWGEGGPRRKGRALSTEIQTVAIANQPEHPESAQTSDRAVAGCFSLLYVWQQIYPRPSVSPPEHILILSIPQSSTAALLLVSLISFLSGLIQQPLDCFSYFD